MGVGETITVINRSGKVVSSSRHILDAFKEAKSAYRERKAEIRAERNAQHQQEKQLRESMKALRLKDDDDVRSRASSHRSRGTHRSKSHRHGHGHERTHRYDYDLAGDDHDDPPRALARRHTDMAVHEPHAKPQRSHSDSHIDMDLAYGELPPPHPSDSYDEELREKASKLTRLLDEANCLHHSVSTTIDNLQKNPDALAAVALTLGEISTVVGKMGPSVLPLLKGSFPAVAALLVSPQFMIAGGVAIGVTIVALGGYKIIRKIQDQKENAPVPMAMPILEEPAQLDQLEQLETRELSRIEVWRRGIAEVEAESAGTTVDGEFITPGATRQLVAAGVLDQDDVRSRRKSRAGGEDRERREKSHRAKSTTSSRASTSRSKSTKESSKKKKKEPSGLRMLFRSHTTRD